MRDKRRSAKVPETFGTGTKRAASPAATGGTETRASKQAKTSEEELAKGMKLIEWLEDEWTCPITYALFVDPVEAEDGKVYERAAIEEHFATQPEGLTCLSPVKRTVMGKRLLPATWIAEAVTKMVETGLVDAESAAAWRRSKLDMVQVAALKAKAEAGDAHAMGRLGFSYRDGTRGLKRDAKEAFKWFKKAADHYDPPAATSCGVAYINGSGVARNHTRGIAMISRAAAFGSEHACSVLGWANECGHHGFDKDPEEATLWYKKMQACACKDSVDVYRERAAKWLSEHP